MRRSWRLKATIENFPMRGSRAMPRKNEIRAFMFNGCKNPSAQARGGEVKNTFPESRAHPLGAVPHQPVYVILAFSHVEAALQIGVAMRVLFDLRHVHPLRHVNRLVLMLIGSNPEDHGEEILRSSQFLQWYAHFVTGMEPKVEAEDGLDLRGCTRKVLAGLLRFQNGRVGVKEVRLATRPGAGQNSLPAPGAGQQQQTERCAQTRNRKSL